MPVSRRGFLRTLTAGAVASSAVAWAGTAGATAGVSRRTERDRDGYLLLDSNENAYGPSAKVLEAVQSATENIHRYPFRDYEGIISDIASLHRVDSNRVLLGCGSTDLLRAAAAAFSKTGQRVLTAAPTFEDLGTYAKTRGADVASVPLRSDFAHDLEAMRRRIEGPAGLVYICNPNNPTASITPRADIEDFLAHLPASWLVVIDEAYHHYVNASARYVSFLDRPADDERVVVLRTFSKIHALAGLRIGYAVAAPQLIAQLEAQLTDIDLNTVAVAAARAALKDDAAVREAVKRNTDDRQEFFNQAMARMLKPIDSQTNFVMMDAHQPADHVIDHFLKNKIRIGRHFPPLKHHVRVSLGTPAAMEEFWRVWDLMPRVMSM